MFTYKTWQCFCAEIIRNGYRCLRAMDISNIVDQDEQFIILKHDVETTPEKALIIAKIEHDHNIQATYYVQSDLLKDKENLRILKQIKSLGHEVAYHYDVLDHNKGNWQKSILEFQKTLILFEGYGFDVHTVCPHGNPIIKRKGWSSNKDFFKSKEVIDKYQNITDIVVNFAERTGKQYLYISDAGYSWKLISDIINNDKAGTKPDVHLNGIVEIVELIKKGNSVIVSIHPHRWYKFGIMIKFRHFLFLALRAMIRLLTNVPIMRKLFNKFYYIAKKI